MKYDLVIGGAGISGCTLANRLADQTNWQILILEQRPQIGGNCYDELDRQGVLVHKYGPHIFHTSNQQVWDYLSQFTAWHEFKHRVKSYLHGKLYPIPINLDTINVFFDVDLQEDEVEDFLAGKRIRVEQIRNSRDVVVSKYGTELYEAFIKNYTFKQWDCYPDDLEPEVLQRLPVRFDRQADYFNDQYQGVPEAGYTPIFQKMLDHPQITVRLNTRYQEALPDLDYERLVITGPIDEYFDYSLGALKYRCLRFEFEHLPQESFQNLAVINYPGGEPFTRITEMKKLTFQKHPGTTICREYPSWQGEPSYPVPQKEQKALYRRYEQLAEQEQTKGVFFLGRLGRYKYINMDQAVAEAMELGDYINSKTIE